MKSIKVSGAIALLAFATPALADMTANYIGPNGAMTMKIEVASNGDMRGQTGAPNAYFITRDGHGYMIQATFDGPAVMRVEDMATVMAEQMKKMMPNMPPPNGKDAPSFALAKGGEVTIRGRKGIAYYMGVAKDGKPIGDPIVVISTDPDLAPIGVAMASQFNMSVAMMGQVLGDASPWKGMQDVLKTGAPIVFTGLQLATVNHDLIPAARFVLPAEPLKIDDVRKTMGAGPK
ncbi:hypothetical protein [uncultured Sphingomonas sp.]|uniref:hypothetical protein n=1 Tax=uncultured Sphingomonas sp. TaxID=158754 RepID=UPI0025DFEDCA|nr:hypothetical protein [uncultured Sphingomonas sp.]